MQVVAYPPLGVPQVVAVTAADGSFAAMAKGVEASMKGDAAAMVPSPEAGFNGSMANLTAARDHGDEVAGRIPAGRIGTDEDMAGVAIYLASRAGDYVVGQTFAVDGGVTLARG